MKTYDEIKSTGRLKCALVLFFVLLLFGSAGYVMAAPTANFTMSSALGIVPMSVQFTDTSTGGPMVNWTWNFQDATPLVTVPNPTHLFETAGEFPVTLVVWNATESSSMMHFVNVSPLTQFTQNTTTGYAPLTVQFTDTSLGNPENWTWQFGDSGNISNVKSPMYTFYKSGVYTVNLTSRKNSMSSQSANTTITVNPKADFTITPSSGFAGTTSFQFDASATTGGPTLVYSWGFEAWNQSNTLPAVFTRTFGTANTYPIKLTVTGNGGTSDVTNRTLTVNPVANFTAIPSNIVEGRPVSFDGTASAGNLSSSPVGTWSWNFGDNTTGTGMTTTHIFAPGKFTVTLTVTKNGLTNSTTRTVSSDSGNLNVLRSGINGNTYFKASRYVIQAYSGQYVNLTAYSTRYPFRLYPSENTETLYHWEIWTDNGYWSYNTYSATTNSNEIVSDLSNRPGIYTVKLTVYDARGSYTVTKPNLIVVR